METDRPDWVDKGLANSEQLSAAVAASVATRIACGTRGSFANERLSLADPPDLTGDLVYTLQHI